MGLPKRTWAFLALLLFNCWEASLVGWRPLIIGNVCLMVALLGLTLLLAWLKRAR
jgi:hypothetical protein